MSQLPKTIRFILCLLLVSSGCVYAQTDLVNYGTRITIQAGATLFISGDYIDNSGAPTAMQSDEFKGSLDAPLFLSGTLQINGNIQNESIIPLSSPPSGTNLIFEFENAANTGKVVLGGSGDQYLTSSVHNDFYFQNLDVNKTSGVVVLQENIKVDNNLTLTSGSINLNSKDISLGNYGKGALETEVNKIYGSSGTVKQLGEYSIIPGTDSNFKYMGVGYESAENFSLVTFQRIHNSTGFPDAADGVTGIRSYRMKTSNPSSTFKKLHFYYHANELNGLDENNIALYVSNDGGGTWVNLTTSVDKVNKIVTAIDVPIKGDNTFNTIFVLAPESCAVHNPDITITMNSNVISNLDIDICEKSDLALSIPSGPSDTFYEWDTPRGIRNTPDYTALNLDSAADDYHHHRYHILVRNPTGCREQRTLNIDVRSIPQTDFTITPNPDTNFICFGTQLTFDDTSFTSDGTPITQWHYEYDDGPGTSSASKLNTFTYPSAGKKYPRLFVTSQYGCVSPVKDRLATIETLPTTSFVMSNAPTATICEDIDLYLVNESAYTSYDGQTDDGTGLSYAWDLGDSNTSTALDPVHAYVTFGTYPIHLRTTVDYTGCYSDMTQSILVNPEPIPAFTPKVEGSIITDVCAGIYVDFENSSVMPPTFDPTMTYSWNFDDGTSSTDVSPHKQFDEQKYLYNVIVTATSVAFGCFESTNKTINVHPAPQGTFTIADPDICFDENATFLNNTTLAFGTLSYQWDFGDGNNSILATPLPYLYTDSRQYTVTLNRTSDFGCTNSLSRNIIVHPKPVVAFQHLNACDERPVEFYNNSVIQSDIIKDYLWTFGDNTTALDKGPFHVYPNYGPYSVTLKATSDYGCNNEITQSINVYRNPAFNLGAAIAGCATSYLINPASDGSAFLPGGSTYQWTNANNDLLSTTSQLTVNESGVYSVSIVSPSPESCQSKINVPLFLFQPADLGNTISACAQVVLDAEANLPGEKSKAQQTLYQWKKNGVNVSTSQGLTVTETGDYELIITRIVAGTSCSSADQVHIDIELPLTATLPSQITKCESETVILDAGVAAQSYQWINLNTGAIEGTQSTLTVNQSGIYQVNVSNGVCAASARSEVTFSPAPAVSFTVSSVVACAGQSLTFTDISFADVGTIASTQWNFGDGTTLDDQVVAVKSYPVAGDYIVTLTGTTESGCTKTYSRTITVKDAPVANFTAADLCQNEAVTITNNSTPSGATFEWDFNDGTTSTLSAPVKSFETSGSKNISLTVTTQGCSVTASQLVNVHAIPDLEFGNQVTTCGTGVVLDALNPGSTYRWFDPQNSSTTLSTTQQFVMNSDGDIGLEIINAAGCRVTDVTSVSLNVPIVIDLGTDRTICDTEKLDAGYFPGAQYSWNTGETTRTIDVTQSGLYNIAVIDQNGCNGSASVTIDVKETPVIAGWINNQSTCEGAELELIAGTNSSYDYTWSTGESTTSISITGAGNYDVTVANGSCSVNKSTTIAINASPIADFSATSICSGQSLTFANSSQWTGSGTLTYLWSLGDNIFSANENPEKAYTTAGNPSVTLKAESENGCSNEITKQVDVKYVPLAEFTVPDNCTESQVIINNNSTYDGAGDVTYQWNSGNGDSYSGLTPPFIYPNAGTYLITLQASTADGCSDIYVQEIKIGTTPSLAGWENSIASCNSTVTLDAGNAGSSYVWSDTSTQQTLSVNQNGFYQVAITSPDGCSVNAGTTVAFNNQVQPLLDDNMEGCGSVLIDPKVDAATYLWSTGEQTKTITVLNSNMYSVQVISSQLCIGNDATTVSVYPVPTFDLGNDRSVCEGEKVNLETAIVIPATYEWSTQETTSSIKVTNSGGYSLVVTSDHNCSFRDNVNVTFHALPVLNFDNTITSCGDLKLDAQNQGSQYSWSTGSTQQSVTISQSGDYSIQVINSNNCSASETMAVTILSLPALELGQDVTLCNGQTIILDAGDASAYSWSDNSNERHRIAGSTGTYKVAITGSNGCITSDAILVTVRPSLGLELGPDRVLCNNSGVLITPGVNNVSYQWGSDNGFVSQEKEIRPNQSGRYWVTIIDSYSCTMSDSVMVSPTTESIEASFLVPSVVGQGDMVQFAELNEGDELTYQWAFGDGATSSDKNPTHRYAKEGDYHPTLTVSNGVCSDVLTKTITVRIGRFESDPAPDLPQFIDFVDTNLSPNPSSGLVAVKLSLTTEAQVIVHVYSLEGVLLAEDLRLLKEDVINFDLSNFSEGTYLIRIIAGNKIKVLKVVKTGRN